MNKEQEMSKDVVSLSVETNCFSANVYFSEANIRPVLITDFHACSRIAVLGAIQMFRSCVDRFGMYDLTFHVDKDNDPEGLYAILQSMGARERTLDGRFLVMTLENEEGNFFEDACD